ncbi:MAG: pentapeptide repeat-containing protein [Armatimonadota bacterium]
MTDRTSEQILSDHAAWRVDPNTGRRLVWAALTSAERRALRDADLRGADLPEAVLRDAVLVGASLRGASLCGADLAGVVLADTDLTGQDPVGILRAQGARI